MKKRFALGMLWLILAGFLFGSNDIECSRQNAITQAVETVSPAVVSINVIKTEVVRSTRFGFNDPFFDHFFPSPRYARKVESSGSGMLISKDGYIVTNEHVVQNAQEIKVTLPDGREFSGQMIGTAETTDIAVIKIEGKNLPFIQFGDSDDLIIGEWVIALGNPFGYLLGDPHPTVTVGVISAKDRDIRSERNDNKIYTNMIQTDAAINPGNSGGPLVNAQGHVIGMNTFIFSQSGGSIGIGFAVPSETIQKIVQEITNHGKVRPVWLGLRVQSVNEVLAQSLGLEHTEGLLIASIDKGSPADKSDIRKGDVITAINGKKIIAFEDAEHAVADAVVGDVIEFELHRDGRVFSKQVHLVAK